MDTFPDLGSLTDQELKDVIGQLTEEEMEISYKRRILHGKIDILRAELVNRRKKQHEGGEDVISGADIQKLTDILAGRVPTDSPAGGTGGGEERTVEVTVAQHCPECGYANAEGANYCQRCGAYLAQTESTPDATTATYRVGETGDMEPVAPDPVAERGATLVIRSGGGRAGESFSVVGDRLTVGRRPDSDIFLDDVTVSRDHAILVRRGGDYHLDDCGSLNGTYVNRQRIESHRLSDGDELQIGKYKLAFLSR